MIGNRTRIIATVCPKDQVLDSIATSFRKRIVSAVMTKYIQRLNAEIAGIKNPSLPGDVTESDLYPGRIHVFDTCQRENL